MYCLQFVGVQGQKDWEHDFDITRDLKGPQHGPAFRSGFEGPDPQAPATPIFPQKGPQKLKSEIK